VCGQKAQANGIEAEREGFEPSMDETAHTGFRDRRIQPLCHLSRVARGGPARSGRGGYKVSQRPGRVAAAIQNAEKLSAPLRFAAF